MRLKDIHSQSGETVKVTNEWAAEAEARGTTVSTSAWEYTGSGSLSAAALSSNTASMLLAPTSAGTLKNTVTLANGEVLIAEREVTV